MAGQFALRPRDLSFDEHWPLVGRVVDAVLRRERVTQIEWNDTFTHVYNICVARSPVPGNDTCYSALLYDKVKETLFDRVRLLCEELSATRDDSLIEAYYERWQQYTQGASMLHAMFMYVNRIYVSQKRSTETELFYNVVVPAGRRAESHALEIGELSMAVWRCALLDALAPRLVGLLLEQIAADRHGRCTVEDEVLREVVHSFVHVEQHYQQAKDARDSLLVYVSTFESKFLRAAGEHYEEEAENLLKNDLPRYMQLVLERLAAESARVRKFLHESSFPKASLLARDRFVAAHVSRLHAAAREQVQSEQRDNLANMYTLLKPVNGGLAVLLKEFELHVRRCGDEAVHALTGDNVPSQFVNGMLEVYQRFYALIKSVFCSDNEFTSVADRALAAAVNYRDDAKGPPKASEHLARYCDALLRKGAKGMADSDIDARLSDAIVIFKYIEDKDVFQKFYTRMLAQRLIHGATGSVDAEELMINKLKAACGHEFTAKLHRMYTDIGLSAELTDKFEADCSSEDKSPPVPISVHVLQASAWPLSAPADLPLVVPAELLESAAMFETFYAKQFSGRKLSWLYHVSTVDVKLTYTDKAYVVTMALPQLVALQCYSSADEHTGKRIADETRMQHDCLDKVLRSLVEAALLVQSGRGEDAVYELNKSFQSKRTKFKLPPPTVPKQAEKESETVACTVQQDRKHFLECTVVRIMKTRKLMTHAALMEEVIRCAAGRFSPDVAVVKRTIEALIEKQYLQRTDVHDQYAYLA